jgi:hypothetical protein
MIARNCTQHDLEAALEVVNTHYADNIRFKSLDRDGRGFRFTLTVRQTSLGKGASKVSAPGIRRGFHHPWSTRNGSALVPRRIAAACWHVHGHFFDALFTVAPDARIFSSFYKRDSGNGWITKDGGNWIDGNIGSMMQPCKMSAACDCDDYQADLTTLAIRGEPVPA